MRLPWQQRAAVSGLVQAEAVQQQQQQQVLDLMGLMASRRLAFRLEPETGQH
jgi:hypothetical protein